MFKTYPVTWEQEDFIIRAFDEFKKWALQGLEDTKPNQIKDCNGNVLYVDTTTVVVDHIISKVDPKDITLLEHKTDDDEEVHNGHVEFYWTFENEKFLISLDKYTLATLNVFNFTWEKYGITDNGKKGFINGTINFADTDDDDNFFLDLPVNWDYEL